MRKKSFLAGMFCGVVLTGANMGAAFAAPPEERPGNGAQAFSYDYCQPYDSGTLCASGQSVYQTRETPSGNIIVEINDRYYYSVTTPDCSYNNTGQDHSTFLLSNDGSETSHGVQSFDFNTSCFGTTEHCTFYNNVAFVNGELHVVKEEYVCEPV
jgi:hypothetical protein